MDDLPDFCGSASWRRLRRENNLRAREMEFKDSNLNVKSLREWWRQGGGSTGTFAAIGKSWFGGRVAAGVGLDQGQELRENNEAEIVNKGFMGRTPRPGGDGSKCD